jgi:ABC-type multidrug transport system ATPase subunit
MFEADELSDRVAFINEGEIVALDTAENLKLKYGKRSVRVRLRDGDGAREEHIDLDDGDSSERLAETHGLPRPHDDPHRGSHTGGHLHRADRQGAGRMSRTVSRGEILGALLKKELIAYSRDKLYLFLTLLTLVFVVAIFWIVPTPSRSRSRSR